MAGSEGICLSSPPGLSQEISEPKAHLVHRAACFSCLSETWESGLGLRLACSLGWHEFVGASGVPWVCGLAWVRGAPCVCGWLGFRWPGFVAGLGLRVI